MIDLLYPQISRKIINASHLTIKIPDTREETTIRLNPFYIWFFKLYNSAMKSHEDIVVLINGPERTGKSTLGRLLGYLIDSALLGNGKYFNLKHIYANVEEIGRMFKKIPHAPPGTVHLIDEAEVIMHRRDAMTLINKEVDKGFKSIGEFQQVFIAAAPAFWELDVLVRRADVLIDLYDKGQARVYTGLHLKAIKSVVAWRSKWNDMEQILKAAQKAASDTFGWHLDWDVWKFKVDRLPPREEWMYRQKAKTSKGMILEMVGSTILNIIKSNEPNGEWYDTRTAAKVLGITIQTVNYHIHKGNLKAIKTAKGWRIPALELERFKQYLARSSPTSPLHNKA